MKQYILDGDGTNNICTDLQGDMTKALNDDGTNNICTDLQGDMTKALNDEN